MRGVRGRGPCSYAPKREDTYRNGADGHCRSREQAERRPRLWQYLQLEVQETNLLPGRAMVTSVTMPPWRSRTPAAHSSPGPAVGRLAGVCCPDVACLAEPQTHPSRLSPPTPPRRAPLINCCFWGFSQHSSHMATVSEHGHLPFREVQGRSLRLKLAALRANPYQRMPARLRREPEDAVDKTKSRKS